jgi:biotin carboxyl carrier protein
MPSYEATVDGKPRKIELAKKDERAFTVKIDGKLRVVEFPTDKIEQQALIRVDGKSFRVELSKLEPEKPVLVKVEEATFKVEVKTPSRKHTEASFEPVQVASSRRTGTSRQASLEGAVTAPMTGKIVSIRVRKGDQVKANQVLCVIEAMKMENEIAAAKAGIVREVNASEGQGVNEGDTLFVIG